MRRARPLMIFAAGFGTRMGTLTADRPKPLLEIGGRRLIDRAIDLGEAAGFAPIVANTHYLGHLMEPALAARGVMVSHEEAEILDTGGGLKHALPLLAADVVATLNPDVAWSGPNPLRLLAEAGLPADADALLLVVPRDRARNRKGRGDFAMSENGRLTRGGDLVYTGAQLIRTDRVRRHPDSVFSLNAVWDAIARDGALHGLVYPGEWCDVGDADGLAAAEALVGDGADVR